jgi:hypothetical protein
MKGRVDYFDLAPTEAPPFVPGKLLFPGQTFPAWFDVLWDFFKRFEKRKERKKGEGKTRSKYNSLLAPYAYGKLADGHPVRFYQQELRNKAARLRAESKMGAQRRIRVSDLSRKVFAGHYMCELSYGPQSPSDDAILYYVNNAMNRRVLFCIDVDGHNSSQLATGAARAISKLIPDAYVEPSRSGKGFHFYILANFTWRANSHTNRLLEKYVDAVRSAVGPKFCTAIDSPKGTAAVCAWEDLDESLHIPYPQYIHDGTLVNLPFLNKGRINEQLIEKVQAKGELELSTFPTKIQQAILRNLQDPMMQRVLSLIMTHEITNDDIRKFSDIHGQVERPAAPAPPAEPAPMENDSRRRGSRGSPIAVTSVPPQRKLDRLIDESTGLDHKVYVWLKLKNQRREVPSLDEYVAFYSDAHIRNPHKPNRLRLKDLTNVHEYCEERYGDEFESRRFRHGDYGWVQFTLAEIRALKRCKRAVPVELVQVLAYLAEHPLTTAGPLSFTMAIVRIRSFCLSLHQQKMLQRAYKHPEQIAAAKRVAVGLGYIEQIGKKFQRPVPARNLKGRAERWIPGSKHPRRDEFLRRHREEIRLAREAAAQSDGRP